MVTYDLNVNTISPYAAAQESVKHWKTLSSDSKLFVYTGNVLNKMLLPVPMTMILGVGKAASSYWVGQADGPYSPSGYR